MSGNGWCTHPDRQVSSDVRILVRKAELACRNAWGSDLWEPANAEDAPAAQTETPRDVQLPSTPITVTFDDTITSLVSADEHQAARASLDDEVVEQSTISFVDEYDDEQDERRNLLYRDSRSAIERARERHTQRKATPTSSDDDLVISTSDETRESSDVSKTPTFEPDDFIEEETPTSTPAANDHEDALISEGIRTPSPRARRLRRFRDERPAPKEVTATKIEPEPDVVEPELPSSAAPERGRFDSIPEISAEIELPLLRRSSSANAPETGPQGETVPDSSSYERALKRAHAVNQAARVEHNHQHRRQMSPIAMTRTPDVHTMPDLPEATGASAGLPETSAAIHVPTGTSATLHPRVTPERQQLHASRALEEPNREPRIRSRSERRSRPSPEARQSWWRGGRRSAEEPTDSTMMVDEFQVDSFAFEAESLVTEDVDHASEPLEASGFDLRHEDDLESFRSRLFGSEVEVQDDFDVPAVPAASRNPISLTRRERRPIAPAVRARRDETRESIETAPVATETPEAPMRQPERPPRVAPRPMRNVENVPVEPEMLFHETTDDWYEHEPAPQFDIRDVITGDIELLDMTIEIGEGVAKVCATCRNYRPSEQPGRGWCTNSWAFTHRQMVNETDLACDSTIGCWWLPADEEVWLDEFEVASDATPRVDRLIARKDPERRAVGN